MTEQDLLQFTRGSIRSVWALELLLLLKREPDRRWPHDELVRELRASTKVVTDSVQDFTAAGLVACEGETCAYAPASPLLAELCEALEQAYRRRPVSVINAIVSPKDKMQSFADAFRLKDDSK